MTANGAAPTRVIHSLPELATTVQSREDFEAFVRAMHDDFVRRGTKWENKDLSSFLESLGAWVRDMDGFFQNQGQVVPEQPSWQLMATMLLAAKSYE